MSKQDFGERMKDSAYEAGFNYATGLGPANSALKISEKALNVPDKMRPSKYLSKAQRTSRKVGESAIKKMIEKSKESK